MSMCRLTALFGFEVSGLSGCRYNMAFLRNKSGLAVVGSGLCELVWQMGAVYGRASRL